jgi:thioredoxin 1
MEELTNKNYDEIIKNAPNLIIKFEADWCGPCRIISPILEDLSKEYRNEVKIVRCNVDENPELCEKYKIKSIPSVFFIKKGEVFDTKIGAGNKQSFVKKIELLLL